MAHGLAFREVFATPGFRAWIGAPTYESPEVGRFAEAVYKAGLVRTEFDWSRWAAGDGAAFRSAAAMAGADLETLVNCLTVQVRADRFSTGALAEAIDAGAIPAVLARLQVLKES